jgi:hypothetical protein
VVVDGWRAAAHISGKKCQDANWRVTRETPIHREATTVTNHAHSAHHSSQRRAASCNTGQARVVHVLLSSVTSLAHGRLIMDRWPTARMGPPPKSRDRRHARQSP